ncbi:MAG: GNAT family N-acetyltransferase [Acidobacteria bacterium]|nr:GNAT family N-acetyltransferase [Acidobacteriota bacterium]
MSVAVPRVTIVEAVAPAEIDAVRTLVLEYRDSLGLDLAFQQFAEEVAALAAMYGPPGGALFLGTLGGVAAGCVGVRPFEPRCCEMKRLYVRPAARGHRLGRQLAERSMAAARALGYARMRLDTLPSMQDAQALYVALGFYDIQPYRHSPVPGTRFLEAAL